MSKCLELMPVNIPSGGSDGKQDGASPETIRLSTAIRSVPISRVFEDQNVLQVQAIRVRGLVFSALPWVLSNPELKVATGNHHVSFVVLPTQDEAETLAQNLETLLRLRWGQNKNDFHVVNDATAISSWKISLFPSLDVSPYTGVRPSIKDRFQRIKTLHSLQNKTANQRHFIFTTLRALAQRTIDPSELTTNTLRLTVDEDLRDRQMLVTKLFTLGYERTELVEDPGTFSFRGEILDIFPIGESSPFRIELFDTTIERIRPFDPMSQRISTELSDLQIPFITILPSQDVLRDENSFLSIRHNLKAFCDDRDVSKKTRDPVFDDLRANILPKPMSDYWLPFTSKSYSTIQSYVADDASYFVYDEHSCAQDFEQFFEECNDSFAESLKSGNLIPDPKDLFRSPESFSPFQNRKTLFFDRIDFINAEEVGNDPQRKLGETQEDEKNTPRNRHFVDTKENSDLISTQATKSKTSLGDLEPKFRLWLKQGFRVVVFSSTTTQLERIEFLLRARDLLVARTAFPKNETGFNFAPHVINLVEGDFSAGFRWPAEGLVVLTDDEVLGLKNTKKKGSKQVKAASKDDWSGLHALSDLKDDDLVVHKDHGIGKYHGLTRLEYSGASSDFLVLEYANKDKLYLPVYRLDIIQKYFGVGDGVALDRLGSVSFTKLKEKVKEDAKKLAFDLVQLYAERSLKKGLKLGEKDAEYLEFEARFPYSETPDQLKTIDAVIDDLNSGKVVDRLICGDVGFGKTEVAMRAAFKAVQHGIQVAVLVPTTVLAHQHEVSFTERFKDYPFTIDSISRFKSSKDVKEALTRLKEGKLDIIIGTHRLLSKDVQFKNLGLIIIDEEHRFGVEHKEKLKTLRTSTHVLTLSATPIPRTLHMAMAGIRDISLMTTPPVSRLPIRTYVSKCDDSLIQRAIENELKRSGQVFFVHNRVQTIEGMANDIRNLVPEARVGIAHGQMAEGLLEKAMDDFFHGRINVLVCSAIIESGIDLPSANTLIINRADMFGLSQLYQIRGRVGRGNQRAYAYFLIPAETSITNDAKKRIEVIQRFVELGSGFQIASHDMEIRGGGEILGPKQSGQIAGVGFELYTELLDEAIRELSGKKLENEVSSVEPEIKVPYDAYLPNEYVPDVPSRLTLYRRLSALREEQDCVLFESELKERFGTVPEPTQNLLWLIRIKQLLKKLRITSLTLGPEKVSLTPSSDTELDPVKIIGLVASSKGQYAITPESKIVISLSPNVKRSLKDFYFEFESICQTLSVC